MCGMEVMLSSSIDTFHNNPDAFVSWLASLFSQLYSAKVSSESGLPYRDFSPPSLLRHHESVLAFTEGFSTYVEITYGFSTVNTVRYIVDFQVLNIANYYLFFHM